MNLRFGFVCVKQDILPDYPVLDLMKRWVSLIGSKNKNKSIIQCLNIKSLTYQSARSQGLSASDATNLFGEGRDVFVE